MDMVKISYENEDGVFSVEEWAELDGYVFISYTEEDIPDTVLPAMNRKQWNKLKRHVEHVLDSMEGDYES